MAEGELREIAVIKRDQVTQGESSGAMTRLGAISADSVGSEGLFMGVSRLPLGNAVPATCTPTANPRSTCQPAADVFSADLASIVSR